MTDMPEQTISELRQQLAALTAQRDALAQRGPAPVWTLLDLFGKAA